MLSMSKPDVRGGGRHIVVLGDLALLFAQPRKAERVEDVRVLVILDVAVGGGCDCRQNGAFRDVCPV